MDDRKKSTGHLLRGNCLISQGSVLDPWGEGFAQAQDEAVSAGGGIPPPGSAGGDAPTPEPAAQPLPRYTPKSFSLTNILFVYTLGQ
jgi:hypothetical protein